MNNSITEDNKPRSLFRSKGPLHLTVGLLFITTLLVTLGNLIFPESSALHVSDYTVSLLGKYLCYALLALAVDLVWGYCGILSLGHGAFFTLGGYAMGMYLMRQIGDRGVYGNPELPDFMVFLNLTELPWFWAGSDSIVWMVCMVFLGPGLLAFIFGSLAFRSRVSGVYLSIMTQAMTYALMLAFFRNEMGFGGNNGLTDFKEIFGFSLQSPNTKLGLFVATAVILALAYCLCHFIVKSKMGRVVTNGFACAGTKGNIGDKMPIHHINMDPICALSLDAADFLAKIREIRR